MEGALHALQGPQDLTAELGTALLSAWVFSGVGEPLALRRVALPTSLRPGELLVALSCSTVCGSDVHTIEGKRVDPAAPLVLGHEGCGVVVACGDGAPQGLGARVTWSVMSSCGACVPCVALGLPQKCSSALLKYGHAPFGDGQSADALSGCYATHILLRRGTCVLALPDSIPDAVAAPANCALATMCSAFRAARRALGVARLGADTGRPTAVLMQGCGLLGLYGCALAARDGASCVAATDVSPARLRLAARFGASSTVELGGAHGAPEQALMTAGGAGFLGYDVVFEVCGVASAVRQAVQLLRPGGVLVLVGLVHPHSDLAGLTAEAVIRKCASLVGVHNYAPCDLVEAVAFLTVAVTDGVLPLGELTSPPVPFSDLPAAIDLAKKGEYARVVVLNHT